ncbi:MAG: imidazoleglycerol-phosphate dehydratase [Bacteroides sp. SM23_62_1]|nr:MAG: imidazoleglycerol-phosphate dehydratase [Bacteroides sp. SM23_62_1]
MKRVLFIDRDGTLVVEPSDTCQVDTLELLEFLPGVFRNLYRIRNHFDYELVMVSNQDGLGTDAYPEKAFESVQSKIIQTFKNEGVEFDAIFIDRSWPEDNLSTRKPGIAMLDAYLSDEYDLAGSYVIGDRLTDIEMGKNLGSEGILIGSDHRENEIRSAGLEKNYAFIAKNWDEIFEFLLKRERYSTVQRITGETNISITLSLDGSGRSQVSTGLAFLDHMLDQLSRHSGCDLTVTATGDLQVDEHHTIEDTALALGEAFRKALGDKRGIERFGYVVPMDDSSASVALDFGGRNWLEWDVTFKREKIGDFPTEMFKHFFKSFTDGAMCNLHIQARGENEHHKIESVFKAVAKAIGMAIRYDRERDDIPSTKGII